MNPLPALPLDEWEDTKNTLHLYLQIVGKIRMALHPRYNHWWHVPLYVSPRGLTTRPIPYGDRFFEIQLDFVDHKVEVVCTDADTQGFPLGGSVSRFYGRLMQILRNLDIEVEINAKPYDVPFATQPFEEDEEHTAYDPDWVQRFWQVLLFVTSVFKEFRGRFVGKSTPVHMFWHHADVAMTRFSGRQAPPLEAGTTADREAYSHEVISFGFWAGDEAVREAAFYSYVYPEPERLADEKLAPAKAEWRENHGSHMAFLPYEAVRTADDPRGRLLDFLESAYQAGARRAAWDLEALSLS